MKIEKLNENKIRILLNLEDLKEKNIDFHMFMSNSIESQTFFLDMLEEAKKEVGFTIEDHRILIEALATSDGNFILTVTKDKNSKDKLKKVHIKRKTIDINTPIAIYSFKLFEDFCSLCNFFNNETFKNMLPLIEEIALYKYLNEYYLCFKNINLNRELLAGFYSSMTEFGNYVRNPELFERKLKEYGEIIIKENAINIGIKYFIKST